MRVLLYQPDDGRRPMPPLQLMVLARALGDAGHKPIIVDGRLHKEFPNCDLVGVSVLTGNQITDALDFCRYYPETPNIWGGWHPTLMPAQTVKHPVVDFVIEGQGHEAIVQFADGQPNLDIPGLWWTDDFGRVRHSVFRPSVPFADIPRPDWGSVPLQKYFDLMPMGRRELPYMASDGCVYNCGYCSIGFLKHKWSGIDPGLVGEELGYLNRTYCFDEVWFCDNLWFLKHGWTRSVLDAISGLGLKWFCSSRADLINHLPIDILCGARDSGMYTVIMGIESGSDATLGRINKGTTACDNREAIERLTCEGLEMGCHFMFGTPGETEADVDLTLKFIRSILLNRKVTMLSLYYYTPYPGTELYLRWLATNQPPSSLEEWGRVGWTVPQADSRTIKKVENLRSFMKLRWPGRLAYYVLSRVWL